MRHHGALRDRPDDRRRARLGLPHESFGGGSDGNFTANLGIPTLDGLGPCGAGYIPWKST